MLCHKASFIILIYRPPLQLENSSKEASMLYDKFSELQGMTVGKRSSC